MRPAGITKNMVQNLSPGTTVVVHSAEVRSYVSKMVVDLRGASFATGIRVVVVRGPNDADRLLGLRRPVALDHAFIDQASRPTLERVTELVHGINMTIAASQAA